MEKKESSAAAVFSDFCVLAQQRGTSLESANSILGKARKEFSEMEVLNAAFLTLQNNHNSPVLNPKAYFLSILRNKVARAGSVNGDNEPSRTITIRERLGIDCPDDAEPDRPVWMASAKPARAVNEG